MNSESIFIDGLHVLAYKQKEITTKSILFVHGAWHNSWYWNVNFLPYFYNNGYSCYALDLQAHGKSKSKGNWRLRFVSLSSYVNNVQKVVESLPEESVVVVGHSMGGMVVQKYLQKNPEKVSLAILMSPGTARGVWSLSFNVMFHHPLVFLKMMAFLTLYPAVKNFKLFKYYLFFSENDEEKLKEYHKLVQNESFRAYIDMLLMRVNYKKIHTKVLILGAEKDTIFPPNQINRLAKKFNSEATIFISTGHNMMLEKDWEKVADAMINFIK